MPKLYRKAQKHVTPPGTLTPVEDAAKTKIRLIDYSTEHFEEKELSGIEESFRFRDSKTVSWINIDGRDVDIIQKLDEHFGIHPLILEDIVNTEQRAKLEDYGDYLFLVIKMIYFDERINDIYAEQIGLVLGDNFVLSFQEKEGDVFDPIRQRLREAKGRIRQMGADYLVYALLDAVVDQYFVVLERIGGQVDDLEEKLLSVSDKATPAAVHKLKTKIIFLKKHIWPLREVIAGFGRNESKPVKKDTDIYLRDVYDHTIQVNDTLEAFRDTLSGLHDIYLSTVSNQMNAVMKVLTIFAAVFIPLTFIAGVYGMNFENMPELHWRYGYFMAVGLMAAIGGGMILYFKRKHWL